VPHRADDLDHVVQTRPRHRVAQRERLPPGPHDRHPPPINAALPQQPGRGDEHMMALLRLEPPDADHPQRAVVEGFWPARATHGLRSQQHAGEDELGWGLAGRVAPPTVLADVTGAERLANLHPRQRVAQPGQDLPEQAVATPREVADALPDVALDLPAEGLAQQDQPGPQRRGDVARPQDEAVPHTSRLPGRSQNARQVAHELRGAEVVRNGDEPHAGPVGAEVAVGHAVGHARPAKDVDLVKHVEVLLPVLVGGFQRGVDPPRDLDEVVFHSHHQPPVMPARGCRVTGHAEESFPGRTGCGTRPSFVAGRGRTVVGSRRYIVCKPIVPGAVAARPHPAQAASAPPRSSQQP